jgi:hypothetical protein
MKLPVFIIMHDLVTWPKAMLTHLTQVTEVRPVLVDNASTYEPLLDYYKECPFEVVRLAENIGHHAPWIADLVTSRTDDLYVVTDPDLDISGVPIDVLDHLTKGLRDYPDVTKAGLSIEVDDIPYDFPKRAEVLSWESPFWTCPIDDLWYGAPVDTTFAMYSLAKGYEARHVGGIRAARPYTARHLPFYLTRETMTEEYRYYMDHASPVSSSSQYLRGHL